MYPAGFHGSSKGLKALMSINESDTSCACLLLTSGLVVWRCPCCPPVHHKTNGRIAESMLDKLTALRNTLAQSFRVGWAISGGLFCPLNLPGKFADNRIADGRAPYI